MYRKQENSQRQWHAGEGQRVRLTSELDVDQIQFGHEEGNRYDGRCPWLRYELMSSEDRMQCRSSRDDDQSKAERQGTSAGAQPGHGGEHAHHESEDHPPVQPSPVQVVPIHLPPDQAVNDDEPCHHAAAFQRLPWMSTSPEIRT